MFSYWEKKYWYKKYDIVIVGSGLVGLNSAILLKSKFPDSSIAVIDRSNIPFGASTRNAGFACFGTLGELISDRENQSDEEIIETIRMRWEGLNTIKATFSDKSIAFRKCGGYELLDSKEQFDAYLSQLDHINKLIAEATRVEGIIHSSKLSTPGDFYSSVFYNAHEGKLNPVLMVQELIKKCKISDVEIISGFDLKDFLHGKEYVLESTSGMQINCDKLIFCTNAFTKRFFPDEDIVPARNHVVVTEKIKDKIWGDCYHYNQGYVYFRELDGRLLLGGGRHIALESEATDSFDKNAEIEDYLKSFLSRLGLYGVGIEYEWRGIIATGQSKYPIIKRVDDDLYVAARLGGMGVATGAGVARALCEMVE